MRRRETRLGPLYEPDPPIDPEEAAAYGLVLLLVSMALQGIALSRPWLSDLGEVGDDPCRAAAWGVVVLVTAAGALLTWAWRERRREL